MTSNDARPLARFRRRSGIAALAGAAVLGLAACGGGGSGGGGDGASTVTLGGEASLTGSGAAVGVPQFNGIQMAVDEINAAGGVTVGSSKVKLEVQTVDDQSKPTLAVQNVQKFLQNGSHYIVGTLTSSAVGAYLPIIKDRDDVISMVSGAVLPGITDNKPFYRFQTETAQLDEGVGNVVIADGAKRVAMLTDKSHAGYVANTASYVGKLTAAGVTVTTQQEYQFGDTQYGAQLEAMLRTSPDALVLRGYATDLIRAITTARQLGFTGPIVSSAGYTDKEVTDVGAQAMMAGVTDVGSPPISYVAGAGQGYDAGLVAQAKKFVDGYQSKFNQAPGLLSANGYESVYLLANAMTKAGTATDIAAVSHALDGLTQQAVPQAVLPVVSDPIFDKHQARFSLVAIGYQNGKWTATGKVNSTLGTS
jgi:branched-chain amino acid transport system substrate-binding protein